MQLKISETCRVIMWEIQVNLPLSFSVFWGNLKKARVYWDHPNIGLRSPQFIFICDHISFSHYLKWRENISMILKNWDHKWVLRTALLKNLFPMNPRDIIISSPPCWSSLQCTVIIPKLPFSILIFISKGSLAQRHRRQSGFLIIFA